MLQLVYSIKKGKIFRVDDNNMYVRYHDGKEVALPFQYHFSVGDIVYIVREWDEINMLWRQRIVSF